MNDVVFTGPEAFKGLPRSGPSTPSRGTAGVRCLLDGLHPGDGRLIAEMLRGQVTAYLVIERPASSPTVSAAEISERDDLRGRSRHAAYAIRVIEADPMAVSSLQDLVQVTNVSPRTLQAAFKRCTGLTPMEYLRRIRLERAHRELLAADPLRTNVADIADRYGFPHYGRFAAAYRRVYGSNPSSTLHEEPGLPDGTPGPAPKAVAGNRRVVIPIRSFTFD